MHSLASGQFGLNKEGEGLQHEYKYEYFNERVTIATKIPDPPDKLIFWVGKALKGPECEI